MRRSSSEPFFLLDQNLSYRIAHQVSRAAGYPITAVQNEWPERNLSINPPADWEIIPHLGAKVGHRGVWITLDWDASSEYDELIARHRISVLWLRRPEDGNHPFLRPAQAQLLIAVIATVYRMVAESRNPVYFRASFEDDLPFLERLQGALPGSDEMWQRVPLDE